MTIDEAVIPQIKDIIKKVLLMIKDVSTSRTTHNILNYHIGYKDVSNSALYMYYKIYDKRYDQKGLIRSYL